MPADLPAGCSWRPATLADAEAVLRLWLDHNAAVLGFSDSTLEDVRNQLTEPGLSLDNDTWLVHSDDDALVGFGWVYGKGNGEKVDLDVVTLRPEVARWLISVGLTRAEEIARAGGHRLVADHGIYRADTLMASALAEHGFSQATTFHRMRVDHNGAVVDPVAPDGVTVRSGPGDEHFRRIGHEVLIESFKDHFGWVPRTFEDWHEAAERESVFDWSQLTVAYLDSRPVGVLITNDQYIEDENCGYVADIGVLAGARGRGIAKFLLRTAFSADAAAGHVGTLLHVDTNNTTPALGVYESVGMRPVLVIDAWRRG